MSGAPLPGWPHAEPPFHAGEAAVQQRAGVHERMREIGTRVIRAAMPDPHRELFEKLPFLLLGALDAQRRPWATLLAGAPGFVRTPDAQTLAIGARALGEGTLSLELDAGAAVGLLGIELATRRRNRVNGSVSRSDANGLEVAVRQSFGNCPKYIQARVPHPVKRTPGAPQRLGAHLSAAARALVQRADTFFIATASPGAGRPGAAANDGVDVSHRGGKPGFVHVSDDAQGTRLTAPDFAGNQFFNTLGNIAANPVAGLLFIDWASGDLLLLTGTAALQWDGAALQGFAGAQRLLSLRTTEGCWLPGALPLAAEGVEHAPQLAATGDWRAAAAGLR